MSENYNNDEELIIIARRMGLIIWFSAILIILGAAMWIFMNRDAFK